MPDSNDFPEAVRHALDVWLQLHDEHAPGLIEGLYVIGSAALDNWQPSSDIDIVAFTSRPVSPDDVGALERAHVAAVGALPGVDVDGPRLEWSDVTHPPATKVRPWTLHGDFHHDDGCFELNPVTWTTLAGHGVVVRGPAVADLEVATDSAQLKTFVKNNTAGYWTTDARSVLTALEDPARVFDTELTVWFVLGIARMLYTARTGGITSKSGAGEWLLAEMPEQAALLTHALDARRSGQVNEEPRGRTKQVAEFTLEIADAVARA